MSAEDQAKLTRSLGAVPGSAEVARLPGPEARVPPEAAEVLFLRTVSGPVRDGTSWSAGVSGFSRLFCSRVRALLSGPECRPSVAGGCPCVSCSYGVSCTCGVACSWRAPVACSCGVLLWRVSLWHAGFVNRGKGRVLSSGETPAGLGVSHERGRAREKSAGVSISR